MNDWVRRRIQVFFAPRVRVLFFWSWTGILAANLAHGYWIDAGIVAALQFFLFVLPLRREKKA